jgi:hypothetical protein
MWRKLTIQDVAPAAALVAWAIAGPLLWPPGHFEPNAWTS